LVYGWGNSDAYGDFGGIVGLCTGSIQEKSDVAELVLDGRLIGGRTEEVIFTELLHVARRGINEKDAPLDEGLLQAQWPSLRQRLDCAWRHWIDLPAAAVTVQPVLPTARPVRSVPAFITIRPPAMLPSNLRGHDLTVTVQSPDTPERHDPLAAIVQAFALDDQVHRSLAVEGKETLNLGLVDLLAVLLE
jgi:hypothetical protein